MALRSRFARQVPPAPSGRKLSRSIVNDMRGLNSTDPYSIMDDSSSPYLRNARMYFPEERRQVAISTRPGTDFYSVPIGETKRADQESTDGADEVEVTTIVWQAQKFSPSETGRLTKAELRMKKGEGISPLIIQVHEDDDGEPGTVIATSSILNTDVPDEFDYVDFRFMDTPLLNSASDYWLVPYVQQSDGETYVLSTTDDTALRIHSLNAGNTWSNAQDSLNFRIFLSEDSPAKGAFRYVPQGSANETIFAHNASVYSVDDSDGSTEQLVTGLNTNATRYRFDQFLDNVYFANGQDKLRKYDGTDVTEVSNSPGTASHIISHKNRLFQVQATDRNRIEFSDIAEDDVWESTSFIYVPEPGSNDPITALASFQDALVVFTRNNKFVLYGDDLATFEVRQSIGTQGAVSQEAVVQDENYLYFVSADGHMYRWNGSEDEQLSRVIEGDFDEISDPRSASLVLHDDRVHYFFQQSGQSRYNRAFVYETRYNEWFFDEGRRAYNGLVFSQEGDDLIFLADATGAVYRHSVSRFSDMGKPINFEYRTKYFDFGRPDTFKQVRRLYLHFRKTSWSGTITVGSDTDFADSPTEQHISTQSLGAVWGDSDTVWGEFVWGADDQYLRHRMNVPGQATHFQVRVRKSGVDTPVYFMGYGQHFRSRRNA